MSCEKDNQRYATIVKMRELAKKSAKMEQSVFVLIEKPDGSFYFVKKGEEFTGKIEEYIYP